MPIITPLKKAKECFDTLVKLYETKAPSQKRLLKSQLCSLKMEKDESVHCFLTTISHLKDQRLAIGVNVDDDDLVQTTFNGLFFAWEDYLVAFNCREVQLNFERLWHDCLQEESRIQTRVGPAHEENFALAETQRREKERSSFRRIKEMETSKASQSLMC